MKTLRVAVPFSPKRRSSESGQMSILLIVMLSTFVLATMGFAVDLSNVWFHRQAAQGAADAACIAGATDMLLISGGGTPTGSGFTPGNSTTAGTASDCKTSTSAPLCSYAKFNGYDGSGGLVAGTESKSVSWQFLGSVTGVTTPPILVSNLSTPFLKVSVTENVKTWFMALLGRQYQQIGATCTCGEVSVKSAPPLLVLAPTGSSLTVNNNATVDITGGPSRSIEVDSGSTSAVTGGGTIDTSKAGPSPSTGGDFAVSGAEPQASISGLTLGTGKYVSPTFPISNPYATVPGPSAAQLAALVKDPATLSVPHLTDGCPATTCTEYSPGHYTKKLDVGTGVAIFKAGLYYMDANLDAHGTGATMRMAYPATSVTSQVDGVTFYFNTGTPDLTGNPGTSPTVDTFPAALVQCSATAPLPTGVPTNLQGTVLWGPCMNKGTWNGNPSDTLAAAGTGTRGFVMFFSPTNTSKPDPTLAGQGAMAFAGTLYFHRTDYSMPLKLAGGSGSNTEIIGQIVTDTLTITGNGTITMALNPALVTDVLKISIFQ